MLRITRCVWSKNGHEIASLAKHDVSPEEVEEVILGVDGEEPRYVVYHDGVYGDFYTILGQTGDGRLLHMSGELLPGNAIRIFHAMNMNRTQKARFRKGTRR